MYFHEKYSNRTYEPPQLIGLYKCNKKAQIILYRVNGTYEQQIVIITSKKQTILA